MRQILANFNTALFNKNSTNYYDCEEKQTLKMLRSLGRISTLTQTGGPMLIDDGVMNAWSPRITNVDSCRGACHS